MDKVLYDFGMPMGPLTMGDMAGLEIGYKLRQSAVKTGDKALIEKNRIAGPYDVVDWLVENNRIGQKSGRGYYR